MTQQLVLYSLLLASITFHDLDEFQRSFGSRGEQSLDAAFGSRGAQSMDAADGEVELISHRLRSVILSKHFYQFESLLKTI